MGRYDYYNVLREGDFIKYDMEVHEKDFCVRQTVRCKSMGIQLRGYYSMANDLKTSAQDKSPEVT